MAILFDTNILLRLIQKQHPQSAIADRGLDLLLDRGEDLVVATQSLVEFWAVSTRPMSVNGLGLTIEETLAEVGRIRYLFRMLPELPLHDRWLGLVTKYRVSGKSVHDARLVAAMVAHGVGEILTFNGADFARYEEIATLDPFQLA